MFGTGRVGSGLGSNLFMSYPGYDDPVSGRKIECYSSSRPTNPGVGRYVGFTAMWERTICGFLAGRRGYAASLLCRHINVIKNSDFLSSISGIWTTSVFGGSIMWIASYTCCLFSFQWLSTNVYRCTPLARHRH